MKTGIILLIFLINQVVMAYQPIGIFGKKKTFGLSLEIQQPFKSRFAVGRLIKPVLHYSWAVDRYRSYSVECGIFSLRVESTTPFGDKLLKIHSTEMEYGEPKYIYPVNFKGRGSALGYELGFFRNAANWVGLGPLGSYHSWGLHFASIGYRKDNFTYTIRDENSQIRDTFYSDFKPNRKLIVSVSLSFGGKTTINKDNRLVWDYGLRFRIPVIGFYSSNDDFYNGKDMVVYHAVRTYKQGGLCMIYTGFHYAF